MRIKQLYLKSNNIQKQLDFYSRVLNCYPSRSTLDSISFQIGYTLLSFEESNTAAPYHFAINIPSNQEHEALEWVQKRVPLIKDGDIALINFSNWNAKAVYFYDMDKNIVELIARKNLNSENHQHFSPASWLGISEIGIPVDNVGAVHTFFNNYFNLPVYSGKFDVFCAMGDEEGLFIVVDKNRKTWYPSNDPVLTSDIKMLIEANNSHYSFLFEKDKLTFEQQ